MIKQLISNKYIILATLLISTTIISILYSLSNISLFVGNFFLVLLTFFIQIISVGFFLYVFDSIINTKKVFKVRLLQIIKSILMSQMIMLPISFILLIIYPFFNISSEWLTKIIVTSTNYMILLLLFFSYPTVTKSDNCTTIKVVSLTIIVLMILRLVSQFLI